MGTNHSRMGPLATPHAAAQSSPLTAGSGVVALELQPAGELVALLGAFPHRCSHLPYTPIGVPSSVYPRDGGGSSVAMTASSSGLWLVNRVPGCASRDPCGGSSHTTG